MDKLKQYQVILQELLTEYAKTKPAYGDIEVDLSFDTERHHYQIWHTGWLQKRWVHHCPMHFTIRNNKIWLLANSTEHDLGAVKEPFHSLSLKSLLSRDSNAQGHDFNF